jgi:hypothetical protein
MNGMDMILLGVSIFLPLNARTECISGTEIWANKKKLSGWICNQSWINFVVFCVLTEWYLGSSSPYQSHSSTIYFLASDCFRNPILADLKSSTSSHICLATWVPKFCTQNVQTVLGSSLHLCKENYPS